MKRLSISLLFFSIILTATAQLNFHFDGDATGFPLTSTTMETCIYVSPSDEIVVHKAAQMLANDIHEVSGGKATVITDDRPKGEHVVIAGTLGQCPFIDRLVARGKLDVRNIENGWEQWHISIVRNPARGIRQALVIAGCDRRGTAYGMLSISQRIGVSPWTWWADVPAQKHSAVSVSGQETVECPSVRYRGFFINDEDWGLKPWSSLNYEKELGDIGPRTYAKVCELLLRLRGNMLAPAMHTCTGAFYTHPESKLVADSFAIVITTSHCEPLLLNNADHSEWDSSRDGEWNYATNSQTILGKWDKRLSEASQFENIYTTAMRGVHDEGLRGNLSIEERMPLLERVIADQRELLQKHIGKTPTEIQQIFVPYKETMEIYEKGLRVPDDVTLVWVDDNYGYMKRVSNPEEQSRSGESGVYYHISYLGVPHDYLWICTTPPVLMYEELKKAYDTGARRYWLLNVGDIKPAELGIQTFFDMGWNLNRFDYDYANHHQAQMLADLFGKEHEADFQRWLDTYYRLAWSRKPEAMGWEREWDAPEFTGLSDTQFSFQHYNEARQRLADYATLATEVNAFAATLTPAQQPAFFELLQYAVNGSNEMNRKFLFAQLNHERYAEGDHQQYRSEANWAALQSEKASNALDQLNERYNSMLGGKWNHFMTIPPGICALYQQRPTLHRTEGIGTTPVDITPQQSQAEAKGYTVIDLGHPVALISQGHHQPTLVRGLGYEWTVLQMGQPTDPASDCSHTDGARAEYAFSIPDQPADLVHDGLVEIGIDIYTVPFFPLYKGRSLQLGVSIDGSEPQVSDNKFEEFSLQWKDQVLRNGANSHLKIRVNASNTDHILSLIVGDPGVMVERIVIDWGGLQPSYVGPYSTSFLNKKKE